MRLARTEINMAYRYADYERWKDMDFVLGVKIQLSDAHPKYDICDVLQGEYPKNFKFGSWHPHCLCFATPILQSDKDFIAGKQPKPITELPQNFKDWYEFHKNQIQIANEKGKLPYFLRDNKFILDDHGDLRIESDNAIQSPLEIAKERHAKRTQKQIDDIKQRWNDRRNTLQYNHAEVGKILGIKQGKPMSFEEANELRANPKYTTGREEYDVNCQSCVVANELRRRGFDVEAQPNLQKEGNKPHELSKDTTLIWILDKKTGYHPTQEYSGQFTSFSEYTRWFDKKTKKRGRYHLTYVWKHNDEIGAHIITAERLPDGSIRLYDPQTGKIHDLESILKSVHFQFFSPLQLLRVDNLLIDTKMIDGIVKKK